MTKKLEVVELLQKLVSFKTISSSPTTEMVSFLIEISKPLGFRLTTIDHPSDKNRQNLLCQIGPSCEGGLMLSGHMDVVPVAGQDWRSDPFVLSKEGSRLVGRGSADMKGFIAATYCALQNVALKNLRKPLSLLWTYDEEIGCMGSMTAAPLLKEHLGILPKHAIIGEPTDFNILRMHAGHTTLKLSIKGKGAHSSNPELGISAIKALNKALSAIFALEQELKEEKTLSEFFKRPFVCINVGEVHGGTAVNIVPDEAAAMIGFRPLPNTSLETIFARLKKAIELECKEEQAKINLEILHNTPAMFTKEASELEKLLNPHANLQNECAAAFATDGGNLSKTGISCLIFGPGSIDVAHKANEWIDANDLELASKKLESIISQALISY